MMTEVKLVGGPMDGKLFAVPGDPPQKEIEVVHRTPDGVRKVYYRRWVSPADEGPLWIYRPVPEIPAKGRMS